MATEEGGRSALRYYPIRAVPTIVPTKSDGNQFQGYQPLVAFGFKPSGQVFFFLKTAHSFEVPADRNKKGFPVAKLGLGSPDVEVLVVGRSSDSDVFFGGRADNDRA